MTVRLVEVTAAAEVCLLAAGMVLLRASGAWWQDRFVEPQRQETR